MFVVCGLLFTPMFTVANLVYFTCCISLILPNKEQLTCVPILYLLVAGYERERERERMRNSEKESTFLLC